MLTVLLSVLVLALFFVFVGVRLVFLKDGEFKGTCASQSPFLQKEGANCGFCGKPVSDCPNKESSQELATLPSIKA